MTQGQTSPCVTLLGVAFILSLFILPPIFGWRIDVLKRDMHNLRTTEFRLETASVLPPDVLVCSDKSSNYQRDTQMAVVSGNLTEAIVLRDAFVGSNSYAKCECTRRITAPALGTVTQRISSSNCFQESTWKNSTAPVWVETSAGWASLDSPDSREQLLRADLSGYYVGLGIVLGLIVFLLIGSIGHAIKTSTQRAVMPMGSPV